MPVLLNRIGLFDRSKAPAPDGFVTTGQLRDFDGKLASTPAFLWMVTDGNDRATRGAAGRTYARVQLAATAPRRGGARRARLSGSGAQSSRSSTTRSL